MLVLGCALHRSRWPVREARGAEMDEEIGTLCSPCSGKQGLDLGWGGGFECQLGHRADITLLHSPYVLTVSRSSMGGGKKKKEICSDSLTTQPPCGESATDLQMGLRETRHEKQTGPQTDRKMSHR